MKLTVTMELDHYQSMQSEIKHLYAKLRECEFLLNHSLVRDQCIAVAKHENVNLARTNDEFKFA